MSTVARVSMKIVLQNSRQVKSRVTSRSIHKSGICNETFTATDAVCPKPHTTKLPGYMGVATAVVLGVAAGAEISKKIASFLEENDLFVPSDDDDDD